MGRLSFLCRTLIVVSVSLAAITPVAARAQHSVAREWNEVLLTSIRNDFARPTVHARNLFHTSFAMYDAWAAYDSVAATYFLGRTVGGYGCEFNGVPQPADVDSARKEAISFAAYRILKHRFAGSPGSGTSIPLMDSLFIALGYDTTNVATDYELGDPAALGNYIAEKVIDFGLQDKSNEQNDYENQYYWPDNPPLVPELPGNPRIREFSKWQPLGFDIFIDQSGNVFIGEIPDFLSPEWGQVTPFALSQDDLTIYQRDGFDYWVYHDPGAPPLLDTLDVNMAEYQWGHSLVSIWSSHLDPADGVMWDISPGAQGNIGRVIRRRSPDCEAFYNTLRRRRPGNGLHLLNPVTGLNPTTRRSFRAETTRACFAEFWADGPDSETPPGHWFTILNYVNDHPIHREEACRDRGRSSTTSSGT